MRKVTGAGRVRQLTAIAAVAMLLAACDDVSIVSPGTWWPEGFVLDGYWEGEAEVGWFEMTLVQGADPRRVTGAGVWIPADAVGSRAFRVDGLVSEDQGTVTLLLELSGTDATPGAAPILVHYRGQPRGHWELRGRLNGGGFQDVPLVLTRPRFGTIP